MPLKKRLHGIISRFLWDNLELDFYNLSSCDGVPKISTYDKNIMVFLVHPHEIGTFNSTYEVELMLLEKKIRHVNLQSMPVI